MSASLIGEKLDKYQITDLLGRGGMATVYKGYQPEIDRYVAIKVLPPHPGQDSQFVERFRLEARTIARLQHPHILPLYDYGTSNDILYLVTMYVDGGSLADRIQRGKMELREVERLLRQIASALDYAHRQGVIHRDIKPENILLDREGNALIADFGIAKLMQGDAAPLTMTGGLIGTPMYMSPEQGQGLPIDSRADIYSLGVVLFEMLSGKRPYNAETPMQVVLQHMNAPVPSLSQTAVGLPGELDGVVRRAMAKEADRRYSTATEMFEAYSRVLRFRAAVPAEDEPTDRVPIQAPPSHTLIEAPPPSAPTPAPSSPNLTPPPPAYTQPMQPTLLTQPSSPLVLLGGFAIIAVMVVVLVVVLLNFLGGSSPPQATPPTQTEVVVIQVPTNPPQQPTTAPTQALPVVSSFGVVRFTTANAIGDTLSLDLAGVQPPDDGQAYHAWLSSTQPGAIWMDLGRLTVDTNGTGSLVFTHPSGENLPAEYNLVLITSEVSASTSTAPQGEIAYSALIPLKVSRAIREILVASPDGLPARAAGPTPTLDPYDYGEPAAQAGSSLLAGALTEADIAQRHAGLAAGATNLAALRLHSEHTINIVMGTREDFDGNGNGDNPGRGIGVPFFLDRIQALLDDAAAESDLRTQASLESVRVCIANAREWIATLVELELQSFTASDIASAREGQALSTVTAAMLIDGVDLNGNGVIEPFEGECALRHIEEHSLAAASMLIVAGDARVSA